MVLYNRPRYTERVLAALRQCPGIEDYLISFHIDPGSDEVIEMARQIDFAEHQLTLNSKRFGGGRNTYHAWETGFHLTDFIVHMEDDTLPAPDCFQFMEFCSQTYRENQQIFSVASYNRYPCPADKTFAVSSRAGFTCWLVGIWKNRWLWAKDHWNPNPKVYATHLSKLVFKSGLREVYPLLSRSQNIGECDGIHEYAPEWHRIYHHTDHWAGGMDLAPQPYFEIRNPKVTALLITGDDILRSANARLAIDGFKQQTYIHKELLIINYGSRPLDPRDDARIRELMVDKPSVDPFEQLCDLGVNESHADLIALWHDQWHAPEQIEMEVSALSSADAVLLKQKLDYDRLKGSCYQCCDEGGIWDTLLFSPMAVGGSDYRIYKNKASFKQAVKKLTVIDNDPSVHINFCPGSPLMNSQTNAMEIPVDTKLREIVMRYFPTASAAAGGFTQDHVTEPF